MCDFSELHKDPQSWSNYNFSGILNLLEERNWQEYHFFPVPLKKAILGKIEIYDFFLKHSKSETILIAAEHKNALWNTWLAHKIIEFGILNVKVWFMKTTIIHLLIELTFRYIPVCNRQNDNTEFKEQSTSEYSQKENISFCFFVDCTVTEPRETQSRISASKTGVPFFLWI